MFATTEHFCQEVAPWAISCRRRAPPERAPIDLGELFNKDNRNRQFRLLDKEDISDIVDAGPTELSADQKELLGSELNRSIAIRNQMHRSLPGARPHV